MSLSTLTVLSGSVTQPNSPVMAVNRGLSPGGFDVAKYWRGLLTRKKYDLVIASNNLFDIQTVGILAGLDEGTVSTILKLSVLALSEGSPESDDAVFARVKAELGTQAQLWRHLIHPAVGEKLVYRGQTAWRQVRDATGQAKHALAVGAPLIIGALAYAATNGDTICEDIVSAIKFGLGEGETPGVIIAFEGDRAYDVTLFPR